MYKRPPLRVKDVGPPKCIDVKPDTFIGKITKPPPTVHFVQLNQPIYAKEAYISLMKRYHGADCKIRDIPEYVAPVRKDIHIEPTISRIDHVHLRLRFLKNGIVRVKLDTSFVNLYEKYYSKNKQPPVKSIIQAYKSNGFSERFLDKVKVNYQMRDKHFVRISKKIDETFNKEPTKKPKNTKKEKIVETKQDLEDEVEIEDDEEEEEDDDATEDDALDVEIEDDECEDPQVEELYISDGDD